MHGVDLLSPRPTVVVSADSPELAKALGGPDIRLYRVCCEGTDCSVAGACDGMECVVRGDLRIESVESGRPSDLLSRLGVRFEKSEPAAVGCFARFGVRTELWHEAFGENQETIERFESLRRLAGVWLPDHLQVAPSCVPFFDAMAVLRFFRRMVLPDLASFGTLGGGDGHGERHAWVTAHLSLLLAVEEDIPPITSALAAALHDADREDDADEPHGNDADHAVRGAVRASMIIPRMRSVHASEAATEAMVTAIREHRKESAPSNSVSACLRDADRLGLAWERGFEARYFATSTGVHLARAGPQEAERLFRARFGAALFGSANLVSLLSSS